MNKLLIAIVIVYSAVMLIFSYEYKTKRSESIKTPTKEATFAYLLHIATEKEVFFMLAENVPVLQLEQWVHERNCQMFICVEEGL